MCVEVFIWFLFKGMVIPLFSSMQATFAWLLLSSFDLRVQYALLHDAHSAVASIKRAEMG